MFENINVLTQLSGVSGREHIVAEKIIEQIKAYCEITVDNLNNIIAFKKGRKAPKNKIMLSAHMDEVGFIITGVKADGLLIFSPVGGIDPAVVIGRSVLINDSIFGVIGTKAMHMQSKEERETIVDMDKLYIDIGAKDKQDALDVIKLGMTACFVSEYEQFGDNLIKAKAIDDRFGCAVLIEIIKSDLEYDTYFVFSTQEELGLRGAKVSAFTVNPDIALIIEATTAADLTSVSNENRVCRLNEGAVVPFMDKSTIYDKQLYELAFDLAKQNGIKIQTKTTVAGGNDSGAISLSRGGVKTLCISIPCRYIHSPNCVISKADAQSVLDLTKLILNNLYEF